MARNIRCPKIPRCVTAKRGAEEQSPFDFFAAAPIDEVEEVSVAKLKSGSSETRSTPARSQVMQQRAELRSSCEFGCRSKVGP